MMLDAALVPFIQRHYPDGHRFQQDNDPKHGVLRTMQINWWHTPASSPDLNRIENIWGSMKQHLCQNFKQDNIEELKAGVREFWKCLTPAVCQKYVSHLKKVIPKVIQEGGPSGY